ncbi:MAG TPA: RNA polymerase sigma factor [Deinococcales bacterium]|nr:RNA polymerase sigma factor [Deinococcales bacterium]
MDAALLNRLRAGDQEGWESVIGEHQDRILGYLFHLEGSYNEALDLCQETFFRAWRGIDTFRAGEEFLPWLYTIARNTQIERHRRKSHPQFSIDEAQETGFEPVERRAGPQERAEENEEQERVHVALATLPEEYREAVVLRFMDDLPYEEIARIQGVATGTAKSRVFRGKELLARALEGQVSVA